MELARLMKLCMVVPWRGHRQITTPCRASSSGHGFSRDGIPKNQRIMLKGIYRQLSPAMVVGERRERNI